MNDIIIGLIIVCCCIGSLFGTVYGWLAFGIMVVANGIFDVVVNRKKK